MFGPAVSHVTIGTRDLAETARTLERQGFAGERYLGGACFPIGRLQYIEVQQADPSGRPLQQWIASVVKESACWCGWSLAVPDLGLVRSHDLPAVDVDQRTAGGGFGRWAFTVAGGDRMRSSKGVCPYFIRYWHGPAEHEAILRKRGGGALPHGLGGIAELRVSDPEGLLQPWLDPVGGIPATVTVREAGVDGIISVRVLHDGAARSVELG